MNCPNCGRPYQSEEITCQHCGEPLGNANYTPIAASAFAKKQKKKKRRVFLFFIMALALISTACICIYQYYIYQVKKNCKEVTNQIFAYAHSMDFSSVDTAYLPEILKENPNVREQMQEKIDGVIEKQGLSRLLDLAGIEIDSGGICDEIVASASYEITDISADYRSCTVTVHTQNVDFVGLVDTIYEEASSQIQESVGSGQSIWNTITDIFYSLFPDSSTSDEDSQEENRTLPDSLSAWYHQVKKDAPLKETTGTIVYGIKDGQWTIISIDENLFYSYYGIDADLLQ